MPLTFPRQVSPEYGTRTASMPISAVPDSLTLQDVSPGAFAFPSAAQRIVEPLSVPCAVPVSLRSLAQVALKEPFALFDVCSDTFHLKSVHVPGVGMRLDDVQLPRSVPIPVALGAVTVLFRSNPKHAAVSAATATHAAS